METETPTERLKAAIKRGDIQEVLAMIKSGADVHYQDEHGYDALINAVYGDDDTQIIPMLSLLIDSGASLTSMTTYAESAVRVLSRRGRFDAVEFLLKAGANPDDVMLTELIRAVAFGTLADVQRVAEQGADLEEKDYWERSAWLIAIQTGDIAKASYLLNKGANTAAAGRCGKPPLFYAIENEQLPMLGWLLEIGIDIHQTDEFGYTALSTAAGYDSLEAVDLLLKAGADIGQKKRGCGVLADASTREIALKLLDAGADPQELTSESSRAILGYSPEPDEAMLAVSADEFQQFRSRRFGTANPEQMNNPFWVSMIRSGISAYQAPSQVKGGDSYATGPSPIWCAERFGQSLTFLKDGRIVQIAGEHEDGYDPDFCIYNDVFVHNPNSGVMIYGYPETVFPPTDFHTATLISGYIYLIGSLGYQGTRRFGETPVYRLNIDNFQMERLITTGDNPGWIYKHRAVLSAPHEIQITNGKVATEVEGKEIHSDNMNTYALNLETRDWTAIAF